MAWLRRLVVLLIFGGLVCAAVWPWLWHEIDSELTRRVRQRLTESLAGRGWQVDLSRARWVAGEGVWLDDLELRGGESRQSPNIEAKRILVRTSLQFQDMMNQTIVPEAIEIERAHLRLKRDSEGRLDWESLRRLIPETPGQQRVPVRLVDSTIEVHDAVTSRVHVIRNIRMELTPVVHQERSLIRIAVQFEGAPIQSGDLIGYFEPATADWFVRIRELDFDLTLDGLALLPRSVQIPWSIEQLQGRLRVSGELENGPGTSRFRFDLSGRAQHVAVISSALPMPLRNTGFEFRLSNEGFQIRNAAGIADQGPFHLDYWQRGWAVRQAWGCSGNVQNIDFHARMLERFPEYCKRFASEYSPAGRFDIEFDLDSNGRREIHAQLTDMSFRYYKFPYPIKNCVGTVDWVGAICRFNVQALEGHQIIRLTGHVRNPGRGATYQCRIETSGDIPIDEKLMAAVDSHPSMARVIRAFHANGRLRCVGLIEKRDPGAPLADKSFDIDLTGCSARHDLFDYPLHDIHGIIRIRNDYYTFENIVGTNSTLRVTAGGRWNPVEGLVARFVCREIPLDDQLRSALPDYLQDIWDGFRPKGTADRGTIDMRLPVGGELEIALDATLGRAGSSSSRGGVAIRPTWFPYELRNLSGRIVVGDGRVVLQHIRGEHGRAWVSAEGQGHYDRQQWGIRLDDILAGSLRVDEDLLVALPEGLARSVRGLAFEGQVTASGEISIAGRLAPQAAPTIAQVGFSPGFEPAALFDPQVQMDWDLRLDVDQGKLELGLPLRNVFGQIRLKGRQSGDLAECKGQLEIDSLTAYGIQVTGIQGPIWLDNDRVLVGAYTSQIDPEDAQRSLIGQVFGGQIRLDGQILFQDENPFFVQATLANSSLTDVALEIAPQFRDIRGDAFAWLQLAGNSDDWESIRGQGNVQLRDAEIYQLPLMLALLKILRIKEVTRTAFDTCLVNFQIFGDEIEMDRIELIGDAISLIGNGKMNLDRDVEFNFYSVMGRNRWYIPLLSEVYQAGAQRILWIEVDGTLDNPRTRRNVLPQLNDSLKQLFSGTSLVQPGVPDE